MKYHQKYTICLGFLQLCLDNCFLVRLTASNNGWGQRMCLQWNLCSFLFFISLGLLTYLTPYLVKYRGFAYVMNIWGTRAFVTSCKIDVIIIIHGSCLLSWNNQDISQGLLFSHSPICIDTVLYVKINIVTSI